MGCMDAANWYKISVPDTKSGNALYPSMGRKHIQTLGQNKLSFTSEPRAIYKTIDYFYVFIGSTLIQVDKNYNEVVLGTTALGGPIWFSYLPVGKLVYAMFTTMNGIYVITENGNTVTMQLVTDHNAPRNPLYIATFGYSFVVSDANTPTFYLSQVNLGGAFDPTNCFTIGSGPLFNNASGVIRQIGVLFNQMYIFTDFTTDIWANITSVFTVGETSTTFPFKLNTSYNWDFGMADPNSLDISFGRMTWLAKNNAGLVSFVTSFGQQPQDISSQAINVLLENSTQVDTLSPFLTGNTIGFLYQYENTVFYRASAGPYTGTEILDQDNDSECIEFNFDTKTWSRCIEVNGERNRIRRHIYFNNIHIVTVLDDPALYEMAGNIYYNELRTPDTDIQAPDAFSKYPFRYELTTQQFYQPDYSEFITDYIEIDFVFGLKDFYKSLAPFANTTFIIHELPAPDGTPQFVIAENAAIDGSPIFMITDMSNTPGFDDNHYYALYKPHVELYYTDDGGVSFISADVREFSQIGQYIWKMRWNELGTSRNRAYRLICVSSAPIVVLGAVQNIRRASGGQN